MKFTQFITFINVFHVIIRLLFANVQLANVSTLGRTRIIDRLFKMENIQRLKSYDVNCKCALVLRSNETFPQVLSYNFIYDAKYPSPFEKSCNESCLLQLLRRSACEEGHKTEMTVVSLHSRATTSAKWSPPFLMNITDISSRNCLSSTLTPTARHENDEYPHKNEIMLQVESKHSKPHHFSRLHVKYKPYELPKSISFKNQINPLNTSQNDKLKVSSINNNFKYIIKALTKQKQITKKMMKELVKKNEGIKNLEKLINGLLRERSENIQLQENSHNLKRNEVSTNWLQEKVVKYPDEDILESIIHDDDMFGSLEDEEWMMAASDRTKDGEKTETEKTDEVVDAKPVVEGSDGEYD